MMTNIDLKCPSQSELSQLVQGRLSNQESERLEEHMLNCDRCAELADTLSGSDGITAAFMAPPVVLSTPEEEIAINEVIKQGKRLLMDHLKEDKPDAITIETVNFTNSQEESIQQTLITGFADANGTDTTCLDLNFLTPAQNENELGQLGGYRILEVLGQGGMGMVLKAEDPKLRRLVALKVMKPQLSADQSARERFLQEARAAAAIDDDNIVQIFQVGEDQNVAFIAMQFLQGESLHNRIKREGQQSQSEILRIGREAAQGLAAAHARGLIHRDIKPDNIWLQAGQDRVKIVDFGLVRSCEQDVGLTQTGAVLGTPRYMAPEQAQGLSVDHRCDLFSLGSVLYQLAAGQPAFARSNLTSTLIAVAHENPAPLEELNPELDTRLIKLITDLLNKDPDLRPQTATEVRERIAEIEATPVPRVIPRKKKDSRSQSANLQTNRSRGTSSKTGIKVILSMMGAAVLLGVILLKFRNADGTVMVQLDSDVEISEVEIDGQSVAFIADGQKNQLSFQADSGEYELTLKNSDGLQLTTTLGEKPLKIQSGKSTEIRAWLEPNKAEDVPQQLMVTQDSKPENANVTPSIPDSNSGEMIIDKPSVEYWTEPEQQKEKKTLFYQTPDFDPWAKEVAVLPAEQQVEAISKKLMELNPGFDGKVTGWTSESPPKIDNGLITEFGFLTTSVLDISPVKVLAGLQALSICGNPQGSKFSDLSPLNSMPLTKLNVYNTRVCDLSSLQGMKLTELSCSGTRVADLSPLQGMPLKTLQIDYTQVSSLSALRGMPLKTFHMGGSIKEFNDLSPLHGMPLTELRISHAGVTDLSPLSGMLLEVLDITHILDTDISSLKGQPLKTLLINFNPELDLEVLRSLKMLNTINARPAVEFYEKLESYQAEATKPLAFENPGFDQWVKETADLSAEEQIRAIARKLQDLNPKFDGKVTGFHTSQPPKIIEGAVTEFGFFTDHVTDISPVRALDKLSHLTIIGSDSGKGKLVNLSPLKNSPLISLNVYFNQVSELTPLEEMSLNYLNVSNNWVSNLSPLSGMPLSELRLTSLPIHDLSPLKGMPLETLVFNLTYVSDLSPLQKMPLTYLLAHGARVTDLLPLKDSPLEILTLDFQPERDTELLRSIKSLKTINSKPATEFWQELEVQQKNKKPEFKISVFDQWVKDVQALPAEEQVEAVSKKLMELNPGFDGKVDHRIDDGVVTELQFLTLEVTDISAVRALLGLQNLHCHGISGGATGKLADLSPLQGMKLKNLTCHDNQIADLSPLQGLPLKYLNCKGKHISDLSPLQSMPLDSFYCTGNYRVTDLSALTGMPLTNLALGYLQVTNLSVLEGMPLEVLDITALPVTDLSPLKNLPLRSLNISDTIISDLSPLKGMSLTSLNLLNTFATNLSPLADMPIQSLNLNFTPDLDTTLLRSIISLKKVNDKPSSEFCNAIEEYRASAKLPRAFETPGFDQWLDGVTVVPAEEQLKAVSQKLVELNSEFDGLMSPTIENGVVTKLQIWSDHLTDISPLLAFGSLNLLDCSSHPGSITHGRLGDLSPLKGLQLTEVYINYSLVFDLSPLEEMKLEILTVGSPILNDLSPLKDMPLKRLSLRGCPISDLTPLQAAPLVRLLVSRSLVTDLSPLKELPLIELWIDNIPETDLLPISRLQLKELRCNFKLDRDTELLRSIKSLESINNLPAAEFWMELEEQQNGK